MLEKALLINSIFIGDSLSFLNSSVRGFCLLTESKPWQGQKTLPNYKYCSLFSGGVLLTFALQFKKGKKDISVKIQLHSPTETQKINFFFTSPEVTGYDIKSQRNKQTSDKFKKAVERKWDRLQWRALHSRNKGLIVVFFRVHIYRKGSEGQGEIGEANASEFPDAAFRNDEE